MKMSRLDLVIKKEKYFQKTMEAAAAFKTVQVLQGAFRIMAALHLTKYSWPHQAVVRGRLILSSSA